MLKNTIPHVLCLPSVQPDVSSGYPEYQHFKCEEKIYADLQILMLEACGWIHPQGQRL